MVPKSFLRSKSICTMYNSELPGSSIDVTSILLLALYVRIIARGLSAQAHEENLLNVIRSLHMRI